MLERKLAAQPVYDGGEWYRLIRSVDADMLDLLRKFAAGMDPNVLYFKLDQLLFDGHIGSHVIGQEQAGRIPNRGLARLIGREMADEESYFLLRFIDDLRRGRYVVDDEFQMDRVMTRARLYQGKMRGTCSKGFVDGSGDADRFLWVLGGAEDSCTDCPQLASISENNPFTKATLFQHPGDGNTPCLGNCRCHLVRVTDGALSQLPN